MATKAKTKPEDLGFQKYTILSFDGFGSGRGQTQDEELNSQFTALAFDIAQALITDKDIQALIDVKLKDEGLSVGIGIISISRLNELLDKEKMHDEAIRAIDGIGD